MEYFKTSGTHYEMGVAHGQHYRQEIRDAFENHCNFDISTPLLEEMCTYIEEKLEEGLPYAVEELRGLADGSGLSYRQAVMLDYWEEIEYIGGQMDPNQCSAIVFRDTDHGTILGKNTDVGDMQLKDYFIMEILPVEGNHCLMLGKIGSLKCEAGMNNKGLCVGCNSSNQFSNDLGGQERMTVLRYLLQYCDTTEEAVEYLRRHPFYRLGLNIAITDASGNCLVAECGNTAMDTRKVDQRVGFAVNHFTTPIMKPLYDENSRSRSSSWQRQETLENCLKEQNETYGVDVLKKLLTEFPPHGVRNIIPGYSQTRFTTIWIPKERRLLICDTWTPEIVFEDLSMI